MSAWLVAVLCDVCYCKQYKVNGFAVAMALTQTQTYPFKKFKEKFKF